MRTALATVMLALAAAAGCYTGAHIDPNGTAPVTSVSPTTPSSTGGLPCDVSDLLASACSSCHGDTLSGGATVRLQSGDDLAAPSKLDPSKTIADDAVARMKDTNNPMPPSGALPADKIAILEKWISDGMPTGSCDASGGDPSLDPNAKAVCTSNVHWTRGDHGSQSMHPGVACIACHESGRGDDAPFFSIAGTVYPTVHEPDDCNGASGITVVVTDAKGTAHNLKANSAGNFFLESSIALPYTAKVVSGGKTRAMSTPQKSGDCNSCHTEGGTNDAPGRITLP